MSEFVLRVATEIYRGYFDMFNYPGMPQKIVDLSEMAKTHAIQQANIAIAEVRQALKDSEFRRGPSGGHGERSMPSIDEMFDEAMK